MEPPASLLSLPTPVLQIVCRFAAMSSLCVPDLGLVYDFYRDQPAPPLPEKSNGMYPVRKLVETLAPTGLFNALVAGGAISISLPASYQSASFPALPTHPASLLPSSAVNAVPTVPFWQGLPSGSEMIEMSPTPPFVPLPSVSSTWRCAIALRGVCRALRRAILSDHTDHHILVLRRLMPPNLKAKPHVVWQALQRYSMAFGAPTGDIIPTYGLLPVNEVDLSCCNLSAAIVNLVAMSCPLLTTVRLRVIDSHGPPVYLDSLVTKCTSLRVLDLSATHGSVRVDPVLQVLPAHIRALHLSGPMLHVIGDVPLALDLEYLEACHFQQLNGWHSELYGKPAFLLLLLSRCPKLKFLDVSGWFPSPELFAQLLAVLVKSCLQLKTLRLRRCPPVAPGSEGRAQLVAALKDLEYLETDYERLKLVPTPQYRSQYTHTPAELFALFMRWARAFRARTDIAGVRHEFLSWRVKDPPRGNDKLCPPVPADLPQDLATFFNLLRNERVDYIDMDVALCPTLFSWRFRTAFVHGLEGDMSYGSVGLGDFPAADDKARFPGNRYCMDIQQAESIYMINFQPASGMSHVSYESSSSTPWHHYQFMTFEEWLIEGMKRGFSCGFTNMREHWSVVDTPLLWTAGWAMHATGFPFDWRVDLPNHH